MNILFCVGERAGLIGLLAALADGHKSSGVVTYGETTGLVSGLLDLTTYRSIKDAQPSSYSADILLSVHGREIVPEGYLRSFPFGGINVHPCYHEFPGPNPIKRWSTAHRHIYEQEIEVVAHEMTKEIDRGRILARAFALIDPGIGEERIYNRIYPLYATVVIKALRRVMSS